MKTILTKLPNDRRRIFRGYHTIDIGYPWIAFGAIIELEYICDANKEMSVLEIGSGGSTIFYSERCKLVKSFETNANWYEKVIDRLIETNRDNVDLNLCSMSKTLELIKQEPDESFDLVMVDAHEKEPISRLEISNIATPKLKIGGYFVIDNYAAQGMDKFDYSNYNVYTFDIMFRWWMGTKICVKKK